MRVEEQHSEIVAALARIERLLKPAFFAMRDASTATGVVTGNGTGDVDNEDVQGGRDYADPTGEAAVASNAARTAHRQSLNDVANLLTTAMRLERRLLNWAPHAPSARDLADTEKANSEPGCVSCARLEMKPGIRRWELRWRGDLCRWCYDWKRRTNQVPSKETLAQHHSGVRVRVPA